MKISILSNGDLVVYLMALGIIILGYFLLMKRRRKTELGRWLQYSIGAMLIIGTLVTLYFYSKDIQDPFLEISQHKFIIHSSYGIEGNLQDIQEVTLINTIPGMKHRIRGFRSGTGTYKGEFMLSSMEKAHIYLVDNRLPILCLKTLKYTIYINHRDTEITKNWYNGLQIFN